MPSILRSLCLVLSTVSAAAEDEAVVLVVDPSWDDVASYVQRVPLLSEYKIVKVMLRTGEDFSFAGGHVDVYRNFTYNSKTADAEKGAKEICPQLKSMDAKVAAIIPTSDPTVHMADLLAACVGVRGNPSTGPLADARRNKWVMGEAVRKAGVRAVREVLVSSWDEAKSYLESLPHHLFSLQNPVIFKIMTGAGGEGVYTVHDLKEAKEKWASEAAGGDTQVIIQEFLRGHQYAVDSVSRDGVHKVIAVWFEDFRPANGIFDQYFGFKQLDPKEQFTKDIIKYVETVFEATGLHNGAANTEVMWLEDENVPCLMEINARWAGVGWHDALAVEKATVGMDQITATFTAYLDPAAFERMPAAAPLKLFGATVFAINYQAGILRGIPGMAITKKLASYLDSGVEIATVGKMLLKTTPDTIPVNIALAHKDKAVVDADYDRLIAIEKANRFFDTKPADASLAALRNWPASTCLLGLVALAIPMGIAAMTTVRRAASADDAQYLAIE